MKLLFSAILWGCLVLGASADSLDDWLTSHATAKLSDLTVADWKTWTDAQSVRRQELWYVHGSAIGSFLLPGVGQFRTGDPLGGSLQLAGFAALTGATLYGAWSLLPADVTASGLSHSARHDKIQSYWDNDPAKLAPAAGVMAGGIVVSLVYRFWSAGDARTKAQANLDSGAVVFEPAALDGHFGVRMRM